MRSRGWVVGSIVLLLVLVSGCGGRIEVFRSGDTSIPDYTATDWVTYGDHVVVLRVNGETRIPRDGPTTGREVQVGVERTLWSRPTASGVPPLPPELTLASGGWTRGVLGIEHRYAYEDDPAFMAVGHRYLALMVYTSLDPQGSGAPQWWRFEVLPFDDGVVGTGRSAYIDADPVVYPMRSELWSRSADQVVELLDRAWPDPRALPYMGDDPAVRFQRVG